eukprot:366439-Chlamydomonas_euryale.AAC.2
MVIEYVGELIRPSLADVRERRLYNDLVGCGTYVFRQAPKGRVSGFSCWVCGMGDAGCKTYVFRQAPKGRVGWGVGGREWRPEVVIAAVVALLRGGWRLWRWEWCGGGGLGSIGQRGPVWGGCLHKRKLGDGMQIERSLGHRAGAAGRKAEGLKEGHLREGDLSHQMLNELQCVDATRVGNLAHVLNHSCDPNCYSRTVGVRVAASGQLRDHVVIFAKRDIRVRRRYTYDLMAQI